MSPRTKKVVAAAVALAATAGIVGAKLAGADGEKSQQRSAPTGVYFLCSDGTKVAMSEDCQP